jgi:hypothetical protein
LGEANPPAVFGGLIQSDMTKTSIPLRKSTTTPFSARGEWQEITMKTIGLLGGTSWPSTIEYYRLLNELAQEKLSEK